MSKKLKVSTNSKYDENLIIDFNSYESDPVFAAVSRFQEASNTIGDDRFLIENELLDSTVRLSIEASALLARRVQDYRCELDKELTKLKEKKIGRRKEYKEIVVIENGTTVKKYIKKNVPAKKPRWVGYQPYCREKGCTKPMYKWYRCESHYQDWLEDPYRNSERGSENKSSKLNEIQVIEIKRIIKFEKMSLKNIAKSFSVSPFVIAQIRDGMSWKHVKLESLSEESTLKYSNRQFAPTRTSSYKGGFR